MSVTSDPTPDPAAVMTAAEFRVVRERLGVSGEWLADELSVAERTVRRWESGVSQVPSGVASALAQMEETTDRFVEAVTESLREDGPDHHGQWWVTTYASDAAYRTEHPDLTWPAGWHRAAMGRVARQVPGVRLTFLGDTS